MADKFLQVVAGRRTEKEATVVSVGAGDSGKVLALDSSGKLDLSVLPSGIGPSTISLPSSENLTAGNFVNIWNDAGTAKVRKADAATVGKEANGFVLANVTSPANAAVYTQGVNTGLTGLTPAANYWLSDSTPGAASSTAPTGTGKVVQYLGKATSATTIGFIGGDLGEVLA